MMSFFMVRLTSKKASLLFPWSHCQEFFGRRLNVLNRQILILPLLKAITYCSSKLYLGKYLFNFQKIEKKMKEFTGNHAQEFIFDIYSAI